MTHFEIRTTVKGTAKMLESFTTGTTREQAIARVKEVVAENNAYKPEDRKKFGFSENQSFELVTVTTVYDTANPPVEIDF